jgi:N-acetylmuramoyl-L-alanine amidase
MNIQPRMMTTRALPAAMILIISGLLPVQPAEARESAQARYTQSMARERQLRDGISQAALTELRAVVRSYEEIVRRYPTSGYSDNALWQAANLSLLAYERFGDVVDKRASIRLFTRLKEQYPSSPFVARAEGSLKQIDADRPDGAAPAVAAAVDTPPADPIVPPPPTIASKDLPGVGEPVKELSAGKDGALVTIREIKRTSLPDGVRVSIEMDGESLYRSERLDHPRRVFFDLKGTRATASLQDATIKFTDDIVREIRLGRHPQSTTRVVMDLESVENYSVFTLYNPYRLVVDFRRAGAAPARGVPPAIGSVAKPQPPPAVSASLSSPLPGRPASVDPARNAPPVESKSIPAAREPVPMVSRTTPPDLLSPTPPAANGNGQFSLSRQLGLGVSRIVLDAGHGGHDPGAHGNGLEEAELVLDVALRVRALLEKQPGIEVTMTRDTDVFIPLEERTAIANRNNADLFLSIHANASRNVKARGIETYFLNFASNPEAEAVAARENSGSGQTMHKLPEIVRAIALNNKIDESRDFADMVQKSMVRRLSTRNKLVRDLGVKQAPFVVLIGAGMPSVLAEISFVTNKQEGVLLKTGPYRQQIAESLVDAILRYQRSLKGVRTLATRE